MRKITFTIILLALALNSIAQKTQRKFDYACNLYVKKKYDSAAYLFAAIYNRGIGNKEVVYRSFYFLGLVYLDTKNNKAAKEVYKDIIATDFESSSSDYGIWNNPFSQFQHQSCIILAKLALDENDYEQALLYFKMADKAYPFVHFCENAHISNQVYLARMYAKCFYGLGDIERAIQTLLPYCFSSSFASTSEAADELIILLKEKYSKEELTKQIVQARKGLYIKSDEKPWFDVHAYVTIFGTKAEVLISYNWKNKNIISQLKGEELYQYFFDEQEFVKHLLQD